MDEENLEKIGKFRDDFTEKYLTHSAVEKKAHERKDTFSRFIQSFESNIDIDPGRLLGLTDGIFGMVMTLLLFGMALPEVTLLTKGQLIAFLQAISHTFGLTIVSFILVSSCVYPHEFIKVNSLNMPYLWMNIAFLACISVIPFIPSMIGAYSRFFIADLLFGINIFLAIVFFLILYLYAFNKGFLENNPSKNEKKYVLHTFKFL